MPNNEIIELPPTDMAESGFAAVRAVSYGARTFISIASTVSLAGGVALGNYILVPSIQASSNSTLEAAGVGATGGSALPAGTHLNSDGVLVDANGVPVTQEAIAAMSPTNIDGTGSSFFAAASKAFRKNGTFGLTVTPEVAKLVTDLAVVVAAGDQSESASPSASPTASALAGVLADAPSQETATVELAQAVLDSLPAIDMAVLDFHSNVSTATPGGGTTTDYLTKGSNASATGVANAASGSAAAAAGSNSHATQAAAATGTVSGSTTLAGAAGSTGTAAGTASHATQAANAGSTTTGSQTSAAAGSSTNVPAGTVSNSTQKSSTTTTSGGTVTLASVNHEGEDGNESESHQKPAKVVAPSAQPSASSESKPAPANTQTQTPTQTPTQSATQAPAPKRQQSSEKQTEAAKQAAEKAREAAKQAQEKQQESGNH